MKSTNVAFQFLSPLQKRCNANPEQLKTQKNKTWLRSLVKSDQIAVKRFARKNAKKQIPRF